MALSYKKLFKLLIDRGMLKKDLCEIADISSTSLSKLVKGQNVNSEILDKICCALNCKIEHIVEVVHNEGDIKDEQ